MSFINSTSRNVVLRLPSGCRSSVVRTAFSCQSQHGSFKSALNKAVPKYAPASSHQPVLLTLQSRYLHHSPNRSLVAAPQTSPSLSRELEAQPPAYAAPKTGLLSTLPSSWV